MIKEGDKFRTPSEGKVIVKQLVDGGVILKLKGIRKDAVWFSSEDITETIQFLKKLQKQLEAQEGSDD